MIQFPFFKQVCVTESYKVHTPISLLMSTDSTFHSDFKCIHLFYYLAKKL